MNIAIFVVLIVTILTVTYLVWMINIFQRKHIVPPVHRVKCSVSFKGDRLTPCSVDSDCAECIGNTCVTVDESDPYVYHKADESLRVPNGKWCLPKRVTDAPCNTITGERILTRDKLSGDYSWRCHCRNPVLVRNAGIHGDCDEVVACGDGELVCPIGSTECTPGAKWKDTRDWDPAEGVCSCPDGQKYVVHAGRKLCETDECFPGKANADGTDCICPEPVMNSNQWVSTIPIGNRCISDPCNPNGYTKGGRCQCKPGSITWQDATSPTGWICKSPCDPENNPCGSKGRCVFDKEGKVQCVDCRYPNYQSDDGLCSNIVKHGNVECNSAEECETRACEKYFAPLFHIGDGKKYCSPY